MNSPEIKKQIEKLNTPIQKLSCNGLDGPWVSKVYLDMGDKNQIICPYCSKLFILNK